MITQPTAKKDAFIVMGVEIRTTNENEQAMKDIPPAWERFYQEGLIEKIPNRTSNEVLGIYHNYDGDHTQPYSFMIGCEVSKDEKVPEGFVVRHFPATEYKVFPVQGEFPQSLMNTWYTIWSSDIPRSFEVDMEVYGPKFFEHESKELNVLISI